MTLGLSIFCSIGNWNSSLLLLNHASLSSNSTPFDAARKSGLCLNVSAFIIGTQDLDYAPQPALTESGRYYDQGQGDARWDGCGRGPADGRGGNRHPVRPCDGRRRGARGGP